MLETKSISCRNVALRWTVQIRFICRDICPIPSVLHRRWLQVACALDPCLKQTAPTSTNSLKPRGVTADALSDFLRVPLDSYCGRCPLFGLFPRRQLRNRRIDRRSYTQYRGQHATHEHVGHIKIGQNRSLVSRKTNQFNLNLPWIKIKICLMTARSTSLQRINIG